MAVARLTASVVFPSFTPGLVISTLDGSWPGLDRSKLVRMVRKLSAAGPKGFVEGKSCPFAASVFDQERHHPKQRHTGQIAFQIVGPFKTSITILQKECQPSSRHQSAQKAQHGVQLLFWFDWQRAWLPQDRQDRHYWLLFPKKDQLLS